MREIEIIKLIVFRMAAFFSRNIHFNKKADAAPSRKKSLVVADLDDDTGILTIHFLENLNDIYVEIVNDEGETIYYEAVEAIAYSYISIILTYEKIGEYQLAVICKDKPLYVNMFELY